MDFVKMHGAGNDFVCVDGRREPVPEDTAALARQVCDRRFGVGADGLVIVGPAPEAHARMTVWNADGSRADMCGNALRCVARLLHDEDRAPAGRLLIATDQGTLSAEVVPGAGGAVAVRTEAGRPVFERGRIPMLGGPGSVIEEPLEAAGRTWRVTALFLGNPHCVVFMDGIDGLDLSRIGPGFERHPSFPRRVNAGFVEVQSRNEVRQRTWERGVGETLACGTGASAACVAGVVTGRTERRIVNHLRGGDLVLEWPEDDGPVWMTGPAARVFTGRWP